MKTRLTSILLLEILGLTICGLVAVLGIPTEPLPTAKAKRYAPALDTYAKSVLPLLQKHCLDCHSAKVKKGGLDLQRFATQKDVLQDPTPWQHVLEQLDAGQMPPVSRPQPTAEQKKTLIAFIRGLLEAEARLRAGDPGHIPMRRLSNAEYNNTIRDLTGVDLQPTREFPADGAAGEGFTNAAEALSAISPTLFTKYFNAARETADHAELLPDGFRFSKFKTRRDWTDENTARLRAFLSQFADADGKLPLAPYLTATLKHRTALSSGTRALEQIAKQERLSARYLRVLWEMLNANTPSYPLQTAREHWRKATEKDVPTLEAEIAVWQAALWRTVRVGNYIQPIGAGYAESLTRQIPNDPTPTDIQPLRLSFKPAPGQSEVRLSLTTRDLLPSGKGNVVWQRPRFEAPGKPPLLLRDYARFGTAYEVDYPTAFADTARYLEAARETARDKTTTLEDLAKKQGLDTAFLSRWVTALDITRTPKEQNPDYAGRLVPAALLKPLGEKSPQDNNRPAIRGWRRQGSELPTLLTNSSDTVEYIPGKATPHSVVVHPTPREFVAVVWQSPIAGKVSISAKITHAHPSCGNGVAWWLEHRRGGRAGVLSEGLVELGGEAKIPPWIRRVEQGDRILLAVDAKNGDHGCDLTEIGFTVTQIAAGGQRWDLASDIADSVQEGNPHADRYGNRETWSFVEGPSRSVSSTAGTLIPANSLLGQWREAVLNAVPPNVIASIEERVQRLLSAPRPTQEKDPNRALYDNLVSVESPLLQDVDLARLAKRSSKHGTFGLPLERFGTQGGGGQIEETNLTTKANTTLEVLLPAALFLEREFVVEGKIETSDGDRAALFQARIGSSSPNIAWDGRSPIVVTSGGSALQKVQQGNRAFRDCFPLFFCYPQVIPADEVVSLKMFHREDEPLRRLVLDPEQTRLLDHLWTEHRFISRQPVLESAHLPQFIGFVTQDQPKAMVSYFEGQRPAFQKRVEDFEKEEAAALPKQMQALLAFTARAYRRPLQKKESNALRGLYEKIRARGVSHEEAFRSLLARVLVSPPFLFRIEQAPAGNKPAPINDLELATRLSYFLWASAPDSELIRLATAGQLHLPKTLEAQVRRMLQDGRVRALAIEFGAQWLHVRGFDALNEKNEKLFPTFDAKLRSAIYEETIRFFQEMFQADRAVTNLLDADYTFLNERLAKHYGIPGVLGEQWRRVEGVRKYGRGGVLGLASIQTKESGASRTSPTLRGNWVVETLLGEKLPRPPANVPRLPENEADAGLTMRQQVEKHARLPECAVCHKRIDPYGFALEQYDPIGRFRKEDLGGRPVDARARLANGTTFTGMEGLRSYLRKEKSDVIMRLFCRRLLGYSLGRAVAPSDQLLIDKMARDISKNGARFSSIVQAIVRSPQFQMIRGKDYAARK